MISLPNIFKNEFSIKKVIKFVLSVIPRFDTKIINMKQEDGIFVTQKYGKSQWVCH